MARPLMSRPLTACRAFLGRSRPTVPRPPDDEGRSAVSSAPGDAEPSAGPDAPVQPGDAGVTFPVPPGDAGPSAAVSVPVPLGDARSSARRAEPLPPGDAGAPAVLSGALPPSDDLEQPGLPPAGLPSSDERPEHQATATDTMPAPRVGTRPERVTIGGVTVHRLTEAQVVEHVVTAARRGRGGHVVTPNIDICRACARDPEVRALVAGADLAVPDGMPLLWASRLLGTPVPERVTGADLIWSLSRAAASAGLSVYLIGGPPGVAVRAAEALINRCPGLRVAGVVSPPFGFETTPDGLAAVREALLWARPDLVFVGLGFPKQDRLIGVLRADLPGAWFVGCGSAIAFAAGSVRRAPMWMRRSGLEWLYRLSAEPGRLARRYLVDDLPFAVGLLTACLCRRALRKITRRFRRPGSC
ncbi:hypothetical protein Sme01_14840 [Sphaerisporangium melleum]|uniref:Glycosyltransferase n=1 Tax=Sphaerisporangium melleum TaxID=321316 RepID=A0A917QUE2_9ACTN|nr:WecB/TagA/CpsF family glycosyltransferase [Sphaerisporangium melleum]GGK69348.1 hypothetical protein GCM10007964_10440 [Sphaerisporangium melleum]GII69008.1 hypothetical protein Sme01_14840 [Sphaerisporangium melleum]